MKIKKSVLIPLIIVGAVLVAFIIFNPFFILTEGEQAVIVRFGAIVRTVEDAGLHLRLPLADEVKRFSKRILTWDGMPQEILTLESQNIFVDVTARWRIADLRLFLEANQLMEGAYRNLDNVIDSAVRNVISSYSLTEVVRNTNTILTIDRSRMYQVAQVEASTIAGEASTGTAEMTAAEEEQQALQALYAAQLEEMSFSRIERGRRELSLEMVRLSQELAPQYGIEIIDVVIRQIKYSPNLTQSVYERMISERQQQAERFRSHGEGRKLYWLGRRDQEVARIMSMARSQAETIRGQADATAARTYANAYNRDPDFFRFWRATESYRSTLPRFNSTLSTNMDYFDYLYSPTGY